MFAPDRSLSFSSAHGLLFNSRPSLQLTAGPVILFSFRPLAFTTFPKHKLNQISAPLQISLHRCADRFSRRPSTFPTDLNRRFFARVRKRPVSYNTLSRRSLPTKGGIPVNRPTFEPNRGHNRSQAANWPDFERKRGQISRKPTNRPDFKPKRGHNGAPPAGRGCFGLILRANTRKIAPKSLILRAVTSFWD